MVNIGRGLCPRPKSSGWSIRDDHRRHSPTVPTVGFLPTVVDHRSRDAFSQRQSEFEEEYRVFFRTERDRKEISIAIHEDGQSSKKDKNSL